MTKNMKHDEAGQVGIGTMIVFIATILVAAVAAGVLIDTSQKLQAKSTQTGDEATANVGTSLVAQSVMGTVTGSEVDALKIYVGLAPGADPVDLTTLILQLNDGTNLRVADYDAAVTDNSNFEVVAVRDGDSSTTVLSAGDLVEIAFGDALDLGTSVKVDINLVPSTGSEVSVGFTTPATYGTATEVELF